MASSIFVQTGVRIKRSHVVAQFAHDFTEYFNSKDTGFEPAR